MKNERFQKQIAWGLTAFVVIASCIIIKFLLDKGSQVELAMKTLGGILAPIIYGAVLAYLFSPIFNRVSGGIMDGLKDGIKSEKRRRGVAGFIATLASVTMLLVIVVGLFSMLLPQLSGSIKSIVDALPTSINNLQLWLQNIVADNPVLEKQVMENYGMAVAYLQNWINNDMVATVTRILGGLSSGLFSVFNLMKNVLIGVIVMVYLLNMKEKLIMQSKMMVYSACSVKVANKIIEEVRFVHKMFGGFIIGKLLDSLIIGIMCFVLLSWMRMPYVLLVSVIIGVTNIIPFFGPFIGAIPSAFLILLVSPKQCLIFLIFILLLQQFDGNILGPKILGDSTGLSSFWVLFSILLFGGLFGFVGMIIGVPAFAVVYRLVKEVVTYFLEKKKLPVESEHYRNLDYINEEQNTSIKK